MLLLFFVQVNHFQKVSFVYHFNKELAHKLYILQEMMNKVEYLKKFNLSFTQNVLRLCCFFVQVKYFQRVSFVYHFIKELAHKSYILQEMVHKIEFLKSCNLLFTQNLMLKWFSLFKSHVFE